MRSSIAPGFRRLACAAGAVLGLCVGAAGAFAQASAPGTQPASPTSSPPATPPAGAASQAPLQSDPRAATTAAAQANRLLKEGKPDDALKVLDVALRQNPRDAQLRFLYGVIVAERGRTQEAIDVFQQLTEDFPELPEPYNNLAVMFAAAGDLDKARNALENAVRALPGYALAQENLGDVYLRMAARAYERAAQLDPRGTAAREKLGLAREMLGRIAPPAR